MKSVDEASRSIKDWFYIIRPLLAMKWLERELGPVPMLFDRLVEKTVDDSNLQAELKRLVELKSQAGEKDRPAAPPAVIDFVRAELSGQFDSPPPLAAGCQIGPTDLDDLFLTILRETWPKYSD